MTDQKEIGIGNKTIGRDNPVFIIAEIGTNHGGSFDKAKEMVIKAAESGADAVKFQLFHADKLVAENAASFDDETGKSQLDQYSKLQLSNDEYKKLKDLADSLGVLFFASAWDKDSVDFLIRLGVPAFKVGSGDLTNLPLISYTARTKKPIIIATGSSDLIEIKEAIEAIKNEGNDQIILLHCVANYPAKIEDSNLKAIPLMESVFGLPVGISDHVIGNYTTFAAVSLGAAVVEKHFTLDKTQESKFGENHDMSIDPDDLKDIVAGCKAIKTALGEQKKMPTKSEMETRGLIRRSIIAVKDIPKGAKLTEDNISILRPAHGIEPKYLNLVLGKKTKNSIKRGEPVTWNEI